MPPKTLEDFRAFSEQQQMLIDSQQKKIEELVKENRQLKAEVERLCKELREIQ